MLRHKVKLLVLVAALVAMLPHIGVLSALAGTSQTDAESAEIQAIKRLIAHGDAEKGYLQTEKRVKQSGPGATTSEAEALCLLHNQPNIRELPDYVYFEARRAARLAKENASAQTTYAMVLYLKRNYKEALEKADAALRLVPEQATATFVKRLVLTSQGKGKLTKSDVINLVKSHKDDIDFYLLSLSFFQETLDNKGMIEMFTIWFAEAPDSPYALYRRGRYRESRKDYARARDDYKRAVTINPNYALAAGRYAYCLKRTHAFQEAIDWYTRLEKTRILKPPKLMHRGQCYQELGQYDKAIADMIKGIDMELGTSVKSKQLYALQKRTRADRQCLRDWWLVRSRTYDIAGKLELALDDVNMAYMVDQGGLKVLDARQKLYRKLGKLDLALSDLNKMIADSGRVAPWYRDRASVLEKLGRKDEALADIERAKGLETGGKVK